MLLKEERVSYRLSHIDSQILSHIIDGQVISQAMKPFNQSLATRTPIKF